MSNLVQTKRLSLSSRWLKLLIIGVISLILLSICISSNNLPIYLIPEGYEGNILIVYNQDDGSPSSYEKFRRVYQIPNNGVLLEENSPTRSWYRPSFWYVDRDGQTVTEIPWITNCGWQAEERSDEEIIACVNPHAMILNSKEMPEHANYYIGQAGKADYDRDFIMQHLYPLAND